MGYQVIRRLIFIGGVAALFPFRTFCGDPSATKSLVMDANNIKTIVYNNGSISYPGIKANVLDLTWKGLGYGYDFGLLVGAKVPTRLKPSDSVSIVDDGFAYPPDGDFGPSGTKWGWLPREGYGSGNELANNRNPATWPVSWTSWHGKYGPPVADLELFFGMDDYTNAEFDYYPFPADTTKRGLGLQVEARYYQFVHPNLENALLTSYTIFNSSPTPLTQMVAGLFGDPHVGGSNDYADDANDFNKSKQLLYTWDYDGKSGVPGLAPGYFGLTLTATPNSKGITSYAALPFGGANRATNDELMYAKLSEGRYDSSLFYSTAPSNIGDYVLQLGTGFFSLAPAESAEVGIAYIFADNATQLLLATDMVNREYAIRFSNPGPPISLTTPIPGIAYHEGMVQINWQTVPLDNDATIDLYYSNTGDEGWNLIASHLPNSGLFQWDVSSLRDGIFYKIHIVNSRNGLLSYDSTDGYFTLDKSGDAPPEITLLSPKNVLSISNTFPVQWLAGDADGDALQVTVFFSDNAGSTYQQLAQSNNSGSYLFDTRKVPNTYSGMLKLDATANGKSVSVQSGIINILNSYKAITDTSSMKHIAGHATGNAIPDIIDSTALTGHTYRITFDALTGETLYFVKDLTSDQFKIQGEPISSFSGTGTLIDGMRIWFKNDRLYYDTARSKFDTPSSNVRAFYGAPTIGSLKLAPLEFKIVFNKLDTTATGDYLFPADTVGTLLMPFNKALVVPFKVINLTDTTRLQSFVYEKQGGKTGRWDWGEEYILLTPPAYRTANNNTMATVTFTKIDDTKPATFNGGESFFAYLTKPFAADDLYEFVADSKYGQPAVVQRTRTIPKDFRLFQNYPNPFNPATMISYQLPVSSVVLLKVFDALGREVATLDSGVRAAGNHEVSWFASEYASGIYFYRLQAGSFVDTKKMVVVK